MTKTHDLITTFCEYSLKKAIMVRSTLKNMYNKIKQQKTVFNIITPQQF